MVNKRPESRFRSLVEGSLTAYALAVLRCYLAGILLATLYGLYYHFPSRQRLVFDQRIFRVR